MPFSNINSLRLNALAETFAREQKVYPTLANAPQLTAGAGIWELGTAAEIVPADTIDKRFRIDYVSFAVFSATTSYEVVFYKGADEDLEEIGRVRIHPGASTGALICVPLFSKLIDANTRISAKSATGLAAANTLITSIVYHIDEE